MSLLERIARMEARENFDGDIHGTPIERAPVRENHREFAEAVLDAVVEHMANQGQQMTLSANPHDWIAGHALEWSAGWLNTASRITPPDSEGEPSD